MRSVSTRNIFIGLIIANAIAVGGYVFLLSRVARQSDQVKAFVEELAYEINREARLWSLGKLIEDVAEDQVIINEQFLLTGENSVVEYITSVESLSLYAPVTLEILSVNTEGSVEDSTAIVSIRMVVSGSKTAVAELIKLTELLPTITTIDTANVNITYTDSGLERWDTSMTLHAPILN